MTTPRQRIDDAVDALQDALTDERAPDELGEIARYELASALVHASAASALAGAMAEGLMCEHSARRRPA